MKTAIPFKNDPGMCLLDDGRHVSAAKARSEGYQIGGTGERSESADSFVSWRLAIECLPEARERAAATAELIASRNPETLTVEQARAFLRGLPVETEPTETSETMTTNDDPHAARRAEIAASMAAFNKSRGYAPKSQSRPQPVALSNIEPAKLKRLAEIRLNALHMNGHGNSQEAKTLKLALDTHDIVGTPLARAFVQLGVDTSKLLPNG
jgi:hypothetical protein